MTNGQIRKHGFPANSTIVYSPYYYYPGLAFVIEHITKRKLGLSIELGYQRFGFSVGRIGFDTTKEYPKITTPNGYFATLPYWQDLRINQWRIGVFGNYYHHCATLGVNISLQAGVNLTQHVTSTNLSSSFSNISDTSKFYAYAHGINSFKVGTTIIPTLKLTLGQLTTKLNEIALHLSVSYLNMSQIISPVLVEYYNGVFHNTELQIPSLLVSNISLSYAYNLANFKIKKK